MGPKELDKVIRGIKDLTTNQLKRLWQAADEELISRLMAQGQPPTEKRKKG